MTAWRAIAFVSAALAVLVRGVRGSDEAKCVIPQYGDAACHPSVGASLLQRLPRSLRRQTAGYARESARTASARAGEAESDAMLMDEEQAFKHNRTNATGLPGWLGSLEAVAHFHDGRDGTPAREEEAARSSAGEEEAARSSAGEEPATAGDEAASSTSPSTTPATSSTSESAGNASTTVEDVFRKFDTDGDGFLDATEFKDSGKIDGSMYEIMKSIEKGFFQSFDTDGDGVLDPTEFEGAASNSPAMMAVAKAAGTIAEASGKDLDALGIGALMPLSQQGYERVAAALKTQEMMTYVTRHVEAIHCRIVDQHGLGGFAPWYSGESDVQTFAKLDAELKCICVTPESWVEPLDPSTPPECHGHHGSR